MQPLDDDPQPSLTSIILPAYVPSELTDTTWKCLNSLEKTTDRESYQLVIVDNGSCSEASKLMWEFITDGDAYVYLDEPVGYARAANAGLAVAHHDWLAVVNTDIEFKGPWLQRLQADYLTTPGGVLSVMDEPSREEIRYDESWFSCWITRREVIQKVGYFDESLPFRFHDQDYAIRLTLADYRVMRDGSVQVKHIDSATYDTMDRDDDPEEEALMVERWGARDFNEWLSHYRHPIAT